jgi:hypothetical protein
MESLWAYALVAFLVAITVGGSKPTVFGVAAVVFASFAISRYLQNTDLSLGVIRIWGLLLSFFVFYVIVRVDFFWDFRFWDFSWADNLFNHTEATLRDKSNAVIAIPLLWGFWMRGVLRGQQLLIFESVVGSFALGVVIVAFVELFAPAADAATAVGYVAVPYMAIGLLAVGLAHASRSEEEYGRSFGATWLMSVGVAVVGIALFSLLFVLVDFDTARSAVGDVSLAATSWTLKTVDFLAWPFIQLMNGLYSALHWFFNSVYGGTRPARPEQQPIDCTDEIRRLSETCRRQEQGPTESNPPAWLELLVRIGVGGTLLALLVFLTVLLFNRFARRTRRQEARESTYTEGRLGSDLGNLVGSLLGRIRPSFRLGGENLDAVRRLYFDVLSAGQQRGVARRPQETPLELAPRLDQAFRTDAPGRITLAFDDARYGGVPPPTNEVRRLRDDWERTKR